MAHIIQTNQDKYVPKRLVNGAPEVLSRVPFHGDQLFEERARNVQWTFQDGLSSFDRLEGLITEHADWHSKVNLYLVCLTRATI